MQLEEHYLNVCDAFDTPPPDERIPVTVERIADIFRCTERNAKLVLRKMEENGWIVWSPGRGRGNRSSIAMQADREALLHDLAKRLAEQGDVRGAMRIVQERCRQAESASRFTEWLNDFFGFRRDLGQERACDTLRVPVYDYFATLDPARIYFVWEGHLCRQLFDTLVKYDPVSRDVVPRLAHHWESNEDGTEWVFYLRKGVLFHHKRELDANDVAYTFERLRGHPNYLTIRSVEAINDRTVRFTLTEPFVWFPRLAGFDSASILPAELAKERGDAFFDAPVGTGPFQLTKKTDQLMLLAAFPSYFLGRAQIDVVELHMMEPGDGNTYGRPRMELSIDLLQRGSCSLPTAPGFRRLVTTSTTCLRLLSFNFQRPGPHRHPLFRQALLELIDRESMLRELGDDRLTIAEGFRARDAAVAGSRPPDRARILDLLRRAGYDGSPLLIDSNRNRERETLLICRFAAAYGVDLRPRMSRICDFRERMNGEPGHVVFYSAVLEEEEATFIDLAFSESSAVGFHLLEPALREQVQSCVRGMFSESATEGRWRWVDRLTEAIRRENACLFLYHVAVDSYFDPKVGGVEHNALGMIDFRNVWFKEEIS
ncbi:ABC transporter substrate-binding protein [Paenibacillus sp. TRM 82003]|nr:ABC transporter substrate-binding protein [Paenibacillus sp. TRM 82003]